MGSRKTWGVQPFAPDRSPKYLAVWDEDYRLTIEPTTDKQGFLFEGRKLTVFYREDLPIEIFHRLMIAVVDYISHLIGLEAEYLAPPADRQLKPQPECGVGYGE
jgi:hypothetical protein